MFQTSTKAGFNGYYLSLHTEWFGSNLVYCYCELFRDLDSFQITAFIVQIVSGCDFVRFLNCRLEGKKVLYEDLIMNTKIASNIIVKVCFF